LLITFLYCNIVFSFVFVVATCHPPCLGVFSSVEAINYIDLLIIFRLIKVYINLLTCVQYSHNAWFLDGGTSIATFYRMVACTDEGG